MSHQVYTEKNFDACLDAIGMIKGQRDVGIAIADAFSRQFDICEDPHCDCNPCVLRRQLGKLKTDIAVYQTRKPTTPK